MRPSPARARVRARVRARARPTAAPLAVAAATPKCLVTCSDTFGRGPILGQSPAAWQREAGALLASIAVDRRRHARRLASVEVHLADGREMAILNYRHLKHRGATDVLTFPMEQAPGKYGAVSGVVIVCPPVAAREAAARKLPAREELLRYILHGALHLLGEDDKTAAARKQMHAHQETILAAFLAAPAHRPGMRRRKK